jgi:hypothetical protein
MAALRRSRRLAQVLLRIKIELLFAFGAAEVIRLPFVLSSSSGGSRFYVHAAHRIFHSCCAIHYDFSFIREFWRDGSSNADRPVSATHHGLSLSRVVLGQAITSSRGHWRPNPDRNFLMSGMMRSVHSSSLQACGRSISCEWKEGESGRDLQIASGKVGSQLDERFAALST